MSGFRFADPLWLLLAGPLVAAILFAIRNERRGAIVFSDTAPLSQLPRTMAQRLKQGLPWFRGFGLLLIVCAIARPQAGLSEFRVRAEGIAIMMCLDRSGSMEALDFELDGQRANRLEAVKDVFRRFVKGDGQLSGRPDDLVGLVSFGGFAEAKVPLTLDHAMLLEVLESVQIPQPVYDRAGNVINERYFEEERATAIGDAVALAVDRLRNSEAKSKVIILLSDGENTAGIVQPDEAAQAAKEFGIKIYSIGVGTTGRAPFPAVDRFGRKMLVSQEVRLDEATLRMMADQTNGLYFNATDTQALEEVYREIDKLEKTESEGETFTEYRELFQWWLLPGIAIVLSDLILRFTRFRTLP